MDYLEAPPPDDETRRIPRNDDAERALLGIMLLSPRARHDVLTQSNLSTEDFYSTGHGLIWDTIVKLDADGAQVDATTVVSELMRSGHLREAGGPVAIADLAGAPVVPAAAATYASAVSTAATFRRMVIAGTRIAQLGYAMGDPDEAAVVASGELETALTRADGHPVRTMADHMEDLLEHLDSATPDEGIPWPWRDIDAVLNPITPGQVIVFGSRPGGGKSIIGSTGFGVEVASTGVPVLELTIEMSARDYTARKLAHLSRVPLTKIKRRDLDEGDWEAITKASSTISGLPVVVDDTEVVTLDHIRAAIRRGVPGPDGTMVRPRIVVVDYLQLMTTAGRAESRQAEVAALSRGIKRMAKAERVAVVALVQLNRGPEGRSDKTPVMADIRESGQIENDADLVILLHREDMYDKESPRAGEVDFIIAKNRDGWTGAVTLAFLGHVASIRDMAGEDFWEPS